VRGIDVFVVVLLSLWSRGIIEVLCLWFREKGRNSGLGKCPCGSVVVGLEFLSKIWRRWRRRAVRGIAVFVVVLLLLCLRGIYCDAARSLSEGSFGGAFE
jgi:hypothetical protein